MFDTGRLQPSAANAVEATGGVAVCEPPWMGGGVMAAVSGGSASVLEWLGSRRVWLSARLRRQGALLLRGFETIGLEQFEQVATLVGGGPPQPYLNRSTPRKTVQGNIFTSTEYPPSEVIPLHNENSYSASWPGLILFLCLEPATAGGETPIADSRRVYRSIAEPVRVLFESRGVTYVRNYGHLGLSWQETFQTSQRREVEEYCRRNRIEWEWRDGGKLRTLQTLPAMRRHPATGEPVWFNQAHLFHPSSLGAAATELLELFKADDVPRTARFGDGSQIEEHHLREVHAAYDQHAVPIAWQRNDLLILDNMLWAHGRRPFSGSRRVVVAMTGTMHDRGGG